MTKEYFTSESVTEGHPDKLCDKISDSILDAYLTQDPDSRVAVETLATVNTIVVAGEVTSKGNVDIEETVKKTLEDIGYNNASFGMDLNTCEIIVKVHRQSPEIAQGVDHSEEREQGAGDQGLMFGYASDETEELMPLPISLAHKLTKGLTSARKNETILHLGPDGKSQVTVEYVNSVPKRIEAIVIAQQHTDDVDEDMLRKEILGKVVKPICGDLMDEKTKIFINGTGKFVMGGPEADTGLTGRKIIVDTYGGMGRHGGGAFSGKDPSKVDRSAAYMARHIAKNIVNMKFAKKCEVQLSYCIGVAEPMGIYVDTFGTGNKPNEEIVKWIKDTFDLRPRKIIEYLELKKPVFYATAADGHFGRKGFSWEQLI